MPERMRRQRPTSAAAVEAAEASEEASEASEASEADAPHEVDVRMEFVAPERHRVRQLMQRLRNVRREAGHLRQSLPHSVGSLMDLVQPYESFIENSDIHELFEAERDNVAATPTHELILQHLPYADAPDGECAICAEATEQPWTKLEPCGHRFHLSCCRTWLAEHNTCPLCRQTVQLSTAHLSLHELNRIRHRLGLQLSSVIERADLEQELQQHLA